MKKRRVVKNDGLSPVTVLIGIAVMSAVLLAVTLAVTAIAYLTDDPTAHTVLLSSVALFVSGCIGGFAVAKRSSLAVAVISSACIGAALLLVGAISSGTAPGLHGIINASAYVLSSLLFARISGGMGKRRLRR